MPHVHAIKGKVVVVVDFCWNPKGITYMCTHAAKVVILDHHESSICEFFGTESISDIDPADRGLCAQHKNLACEFDIKRAGAQIAWDWGRGRCVRPWFLEHIADRDLWNWHLDSTKAITAAMYEGNWYNLFAMETMVSMEEVLRPLFILQGTSILKHQDKAVAVAASKSILTRFDGHIVRVAQCPSHIRSAVGHALCNMGDCEFSALLRYSIENDQWYVSLRCLKGANVNLARISKKYGGGGHATAAGFAVHGPRSPDVPEENKDDPEEKSIMLVGSLRDIFVPFAEDLTF